MNFTLPRSASFEVASRLRSRQAHFCRSQPGFAPVEAYLLPRKREALLHRPSELMPSYLEQLTIRLAQGIGELPVEVRDAHAGYLKAAQQADGGFAGREGGSDLYYTSFALRALAILGELDSVLAERAAEFLRGRLSGRELKLASEVSGTSSRLRVASSPSQRAR